MKLTKREMGVAAIAHKGGHRYQIDAVRIDPADGRLVATDGKRLLMVKKAAADTADSVVGATPILIHADDLARIARQLPRAKRAVAELVAVEPPADEHTPGTATIEWRVGTASRPFRVEVELAGGHYPQWQSVVPDGTPKEVFTIDIDLLAGLLDVMRDIIAGWRGPKGVPLPVVTVEYHGSNQAVVIRYADIYERSLVGVIMPTTQE